MRAFLQERARMANQQPRPKGRGMKSELLSNVRGKPRGIRPEEIKEIFGVPLKRGYDGPAISALGDSRGFLIPLLPYAV